MDYGRPATMPEGDSTLMQELEALNRVLKKGNVEARVPYKESVGPVKPPFGGVAVPGMVDASVNPLKAVHQNAASPLEPSKRPDIQRMQGTPTTGRIPQAGSLATTMSTKEPSRTGGVGLTMARPIQSFSLNERTLQDAKPPEDLPLWLQDNKRFSKKLEAPVPKRSFLNWKPFRALARLGSQKSSCEFTLHVHGIKDLPASMDGHQLQVLWKRKEALVETKVVAADERRVVFEQTLHLKGTLYAGGSGFMPKVSSLRTIVLERGAGVTVGNHKLDLSVLVPDDSSLEGSSPWASEFPLSGKCQGSSLLVSFGYKVLSTSRRSSKESSATSRKGHSGPASSFSAPLSSVSAFDSAEKVGREPLYRSSLTSFPTSSEDTSPMTSPTEDEHRLPASKPPELSPVKGTPTKEPALGDADEVPAVVSYPEVTQAVNENEDSGAPEEEEGRVISPPEGPPSPEVKDWRRGWGVTNGETEKEGSEPEVLSKRTLEREDDEGSGGEHHEEYEEEDEDDEGEDEEEEEEEEVDYEDDELEDEEEEESGDEEDEEVEEVEVASDWEAEELSQGDDDATPKATTSEDRSSPGDSERQRSTVEDVSPAAQVVDLPRRTTETSDELDDVAGEFLEMLEGVDLSMYDQALQDSLQDRGESGAQLRGPLPHQEQMGATVPRQVNFHNEPAVGRDGEDVAASGLGLDDFIGDAELELKRAGIQHRSKSRAKMLEDEENEALMRQMGLNSGAFDHSPPRGDASKRAVPTPHLPSGPLTLVPLGEGVGPVIATRDGGSLRSMSSSHFQDKTGRLVMQVSKPVVVPPELGSTSLEIMQRMAALGPEGMARQAFLAMPMDDITGRSLDQISAEGRALEGPRTRALLASRAAYLPSSQQRLALEGGSAGAPEGQLVPRASPGGLVPLGGGSGALGMPQYTSGPLAGTNGARELLPHELPEECVSLEEIAPLAMRTIENLAMQGLQIQFGEDEEDEPGYAVDALGWGDVVPKLRARAQEYARIRGSSEASGVMAIGGPTMRMMIGQGGGKDEAGEPIIFGEDEGRDGLGLGMGLGMGISLEEWMRLDAGVFCEEEMADSTLAVLQAHHAAHTGNGGGGGADTMALSGRAMGGGGGGGVEGSSGTGGLRGGFMGNTVTLAMLVQLRDPTRNYEPVGAPMMALVQAERVAVPPLPRIGRGVSEQGGDEAGDDGSHVPKFCITGVSMCGLKSDGDGTKKKGWGGTKQQQAGSKWLAANGMMKGGGGQGKKKHPLLKQTAPPAKVKVKNGESLWSISSRVHGSGHKWKDIAALNPHIRDPDVIFADDTIRTR